MSCTVSDRAVLVPLPPLQRRTRPLLFLLFAGAPRRQFHRAPYPHPHHQRPPPTSCVTAGLMITIMPTTTSTEEENSVSIVRSAGTTTPRGAGETIVIDHPPSRPMTHAGTSTSAHACPRSKMLPPKKKKTKMMMTAMNKSALEWSHAATMDPSALAAPFVAAVQQQVDEFLRLTAATTARTADDQPDASVEAHARDESRQQQWAQATVDAAAAAFDPRDERAQASLAGGAFLAASDHQVSRAAKQFVAYCVARERYTRAPGHETLPPETTMTEDDEKSTSRTNVVVSVVTHERECLTLLAPTDALGRHILLLTAIVVENEDKTPEESSETVGLPERPASEPTALASLPQSIQQQLFRLLSQVAMPLTSPLSNSEAPSTATLSSSSPSSHTAWPGAVLLVVPVGVPSTRTPSCVTPGKLLAAVADLIQLHGVPLLVNRVHLVTPGPPGAPTSSSLYPLPDLFRWKSIVHPASPRPVTDLAGAAGSGNNDAASISWPVALRQRFGIPIHRLPPLRSCALDDDLDGGGGGPTRVTTPPVDQAAEATVAVQELPIRDEEAMAPTRDMATVGPSRMIGAPPSNADAPLPPEEAHSRADDESYTTPSTPVDDESYTKPSTPVEVDSDDELHSTHAMAPFSVCPLTCPSPRVAKRSVAENSRIKRERQKDRCRELLDRHFRLTSEKAALQREHERLCLFLADAQALIAQPTPPPPPVLYPRANSGGSAANPFANVTSRPLSLAPISFGMPPPPRSNTFLTHAALTSVPTTMAASTTAQPRPTPWSSTPSTGYSSSAVESASQVGVGALAPNAWSTLCDERHQLEVQEQDQRRTVERLLLQQYLQLQQQSNIQTPQGLSSTFLGAMHQQPVPTISPMFSSLPTANSNLSRNAMLTSLQNSLLLNDKMIDESVRNRLPYLTGNSLLSGILPPAERTADLRSMPPTLPPLVHASATMSGVGMSPFGSALSHPPQPWQSSAAAPVAASAIQQQLHNQLQLQQFQHDLGQQQRSLQMMQQQPTWALKPTYPFHPSSTPAPQMGWFPQNNTLNRPRPFG